MSEPVMLSKTVVSTVDALADALGTERRLIEELIAVMRRQRTAIANDDLQAVDDSVFATHRVLVTLNEARRRRRSLNALLGEREDLSIYALDEALGSGMTPARREVREQLNVSARLLSREVALNRRVLRSALASGDAYARTLAGVDDSPEYGRPARPKPDARPSATLLDRRI